MISPVSNMEKGFIEREIQGPTPGSVSDVVEGFIEREIQGPTPWFGGSLT